MPNAIESRILKTEPADWRSFQFVQHDNFKEFTAEAEQKLTGSLLGNNFIQAFNVWEDEAGALWCLDGRHRVRVLEQLAAKGTEVPARLPANFIACANRQEAAKLTLLYSSAYARTTQEGLADFLNYNDLDLGELMGEIDLPGLDLTKLLEGIADPAPMEKASLAERFGVPPFSVLDARQGYWQERKNDWLAQGITSADGRADDLTFGGSARPPSFYDLRNTMRAQAGGVDPTWEAVNAEAAKRGMMSAGIEGTSIFDPVLCELAYRWFCPTAGSILDPFAGGSVRGLVAALLGYTYTGIDLRPEQVAANQDQAAAVLKSEQQSPVWLAGDSRNLPDMLGVRGLLYDLVFSCPPYADLEVYSDDPADLSTMDYPTFVQVYREIIAKAVAQLKPNRFACFVVGEVRDPKGIYRNFVGDTIAAFEAAGARYYNEIVLVTPAGSLPVRVTKQFQSGRKVGKSHQNVLVFYKGDPRQIKAEFGEVAVTVGLGDDSPDICPDP